MLRLLFAAACGLFVAGCQSSTADLSYVRAGGLGYWNNGLLGPGYLYLWDTRSNSLTLLSDSIAMDPKQPQQSATTLVSSSVRGVSVDGSFGQSVSKTDVSAAVGQQIEFRVERAVRQTYSSVYTALSDAYIAAQTRGEDPQVQWLVDEATRAKSPYYYVVITQVIHADRTSIARKGVKGDADVGNITVTVPGLVKPITVSIKGSLSTECTGTGAPCFFEVTVLKPYKQNNGNLAYKPVVNPDKARLQEALRQL